MIQVVKSADRYHADHGWLEARWHFSFSDYDDPSNMNWSALRVFNDDVVKAGGGFDFHPHRDMEIVSYIVAGELEHRDKLGNRHVNKAGEVQVMSAGRGIVHAEVNPATTDMRLIQLWLLPRHRGNDPRWEQKAFTTTDRRNRLLQVVAPTDKPSDGALTVDQDAQIFVSSLEAGSSLEHEVSGGHAYFFVIKGAVTLNGESLDDGDQARISDEKVLKIQATKDAELILLDLP